MKKQNEIEENQNTLINILTPTGIKFNSQNIEYGENMCKVYGINKWVSEPEIGFLSKITNLPNTIVNMHYKPSDNSSTLQAINKQITLNEQKYESSNDNIEKKRAELAVLSADKLLNDIEANNESVGNLDATIMVMGENKEELDKNCRKVQSNISAIKCNSRSLPNLQKEALQNLSPTYTKNEKIESIYGRNIMPLRAFVGGFPFGTTGFNDGKGYYFGKDTYGALIIVDFWKRNNDRTNSNIVITGKPGQGKSTDIKAILLNEYARGTKIIILDPEREYKSTCENVKGDWLNLSGGNSIINPLQIMLPPNDDEKEELSPLAKQMESFETFLKLYNRNMAEDVFNYLKKKLLEVYNDRNITWETDITKLTNKDYPTFTDLKNKIELDTKQNENIKLNELANRTLDIIFDLTDGADKFLWNGHTTINTKANFIVFDTKDLQNATDQKKGTQYYNVLKYAWNIIEQNRKEKVMLVCDEAYLMIDKYVPQTLIFLRNASKRIRKYEGALVVITHDIIDFLSPEIRQYGQAILSSATYKILHGTDGQNLKDEIELFNLTEAERDLLEEQRRGHALFIAGNTKIHTNFEYNEDILKIMGSAGGR